MNNIKKLLLTILFSSILILIGTVTSNASGDLYLKDLKFDAKINSDGSMDVTEIWNIDIESTNTLFKTFKLDKTKYSGIMDVKVVETTAGRNYNFTEINKEMYHVTKNCYYGLINKKGDFEIAWGVGMDNSSGNRQYKISYKVKDAVSKNPDCYELYWKFVGDDFEIDAKKINGKITLPQNAKNKEDIRVWGHTEDMNGEIYATSNNTVEFNIDKYRDGNYVEVRVLIPEDINIYSSRKSYKTIQDVINEETVWVEEANARRKFKEDVRFITSIFITIILTVISFFIFKNSKKKHQQIKNMTKLMPTQQFEYYRDIPNDTISPGEAFILQQSSKRELSSKELGNVFSACLLELSLKKKIEFEIKGDSKKKENIIIKILDFSFSDITNRDENSVFTFLLFACMNKREISLKELEKCIKTHSSKVITLKTNVDLGIKGGLNNRQYIDKEQDKIKKHANDIVLIYFVLEMFLIPFLAMLLTVLHPIALFGTGIIALAMLIQIIQNAKISSRANVFTQAGLDEAEKWKGLKKFMLEFSLLDRREIPEIVLWEKYMVYATAFGIADKVLKQLKVVYPNITDTNFNGSIYMGLMMDNSFSSSISNSISSSISSTYSSATGGGGGFSGGGGGGRRWRRRRRSLNSGQSTPELLTKSVNETRNR